MQDTMTEYTRDMDINELDEKMTLKQFKKLLRDLEEKKKKLYESIRKLSDELRELDAAVSLKVYGGIPGISELIVKLINENYERINLFTNLGRRVVEHIKFGDSKAALDILDNFKVYEVELKGKIKEEFDTALTNLKIKKTKKKLK
jgi:hypothetical protein